MAALRLTRRVEADVGEKLRGRCLPLISKATFLQPFGADREVISANTWRRSQAKGKNLVNFAKLELYTAILDTILSGLLLQSGSISLS